MVLNINRESMAHVGFSPPTRIFEAAGAASCVITDRWNGIENFFEPGSEILVAATAGDIVHFLRSLNAVDAKAMGANMRKRALRDHTYSQRAQQFEMTVADTRALAA
jgi:spore maturation protein CgeB